MIEEMLEGQAYPELRRARYYPIEIRRASVEPDWNIRDIEATAKTVQVENIPAVRLELPLEDANALLEIYRAHYHAASRNPAVREAWLEYRMLVELTRKY